MAVVDPTGTLLATNDNWATAQPLNSAQATATAASKDAAVIVTLSPGAYTAQVTEATGASGMAPVEIYELPEQ